MNNENIHSYKKSLSDYRVIGFMSIIFSWTLIVPKLLSVETVFTVISIIFLFFADFYLKHVSRGYVFHLSLFFLRIPYAVLLILSSFSLLQTNEKIGNTKLHILTVLVCGFFISLIFYMKEFRPTMVRNIKTGRLDEKAGTWNLSEKLVMFDNESRGNVTYYKTVRGIISPLFLALTFYLARNLDNNLELLFRSFAVFSFGSLIFWGYASQLAIGVVILEWEKKIGKKIKLNI